MSEMVERVAQAIVGAPRWEALPERASYMERKGNPGAEWWDREEARQTARDAIEAMRKPTDKMVGAGVQGWAANCYASIQWVWPSMIDAALSVSDENPKGENAERSRGEALPARSSERGDALTLSPKEQKGE